MGTYHLMGLDRSAGAGIGVAYRYQSWNAGDQCFFARCGEVKQQQAGEKVGDIQIMLLFTTKVLDGEIPAFNYRTTCPERAMDRDGDAVLAINGSVMLILQRWCE
jgi:hypothetical protein